jgi:hypothetical protein
LHGTVYNIVEELFGLRHDGQVHVSSLFPNLLNCVVDIPIHCLCVPKPTKAKPTHKKQVRILNINFQSLRKKGKLLETIIESTDPDRILSIYDGLFFPVDIR